MAQLVPPGLVRPVASVLGVSIVAGGVTVILAAAFRWYVRDRLPTGLALLAGFGVVAVYLNTTAALGQAIVGTEGLLDLATVVTNVVTFALAGATALASVRVGDRVADIGSAAAGARTFDGEVSRVVTATGRAIAVELPAEIEALEGYDPVPDSTVEALAGKTLLFPRRLTVSELRDRLTTRLKTDYGVGHVTLELEDDGSVTYLGVGGRATGLGQTLPPGTVATAIRGDPPFSAGSGDTIQLWSHGEERDRIATGELRATRGEVVTVAVDERDADRLDPAERYRVVTLPRENRADAEFARLLRDAEVSFGEVTVGSGSALDGLSVGAIDATVVGVGPADGGVDAIPARERRLRAGDRLYVLARPEVHRRLGTASSHTPDSGAETASE